MLRSLRIRNYALIRDVELEFPDGLAIVTGETGAGKSVMLSALSLLLGGRAEQRVISDRNAKSQVEAIFSYLPARVSEILEEKGIDADPSGLLTVRREISATGRARIFINDTSVTLQTLSSVTSNLIDIHSQHANGRINNPAERLRILDSVSDNFALREEYGAAFSEYLGLRRRIRALELERKETARNADVMRFRLDQLEKLKPRRGELAEIEKRYDLLSDADDLRDRLSSIVSIMDAPDRGVCDMLTEAKALAEKSDFSLMNASDNADKPGNSPSDEGGNSVVRRLESLLVEARDIYETVEDYRSQVDTDPATLAKLSDRMNLYYETVKSFHVSDADELVSIHEDLRRKLAEIDTGAGELPELEEKARQVAARLRNLAASLSESRRENAVKLSRLIEDTARPLGLPNIRFEIAVNPAKLSSTGGDAIEFLCSFNKNGQLLPVSSVASGGEISRLMLSLKALISGHMHLPTIIFDEVDTGVSGSIADKMGEMMRSMSRSMQVVAITHLPQVAAKGDVHFKVSKTDEEDRTVTHVRMLDRQERIREIASMMSGSEVSSAALTAARELIEEK